MIMKSVMKVSVLVLSMGLFLAACNSGTNTGNAADSANTEMAAPGMDQTVPMDTTVPADTAAPSVDTSGM